VFGEERDEEEDEVEDVRGRGKRVSEDVKKSAGLESESKAFVCETYERF